MCCGIASGRWCRCRCMGRGLGEWDVVSEGV